MSDHGAPQWLDDGFRHIWLPYTQMQTSGVPFAVAATEGARIRLEDGRELIDGVGAWWTCVHGYNHKHIQKSVAAQLATMPHVMLGGLAHERAYRLAARLAALLPGDLNRVFFSDSGSVAVEVAMKMAAQYWINRGVSGRERFVAFKGGYHGDTFATMSVCDPDEGMHTLFKGMLSEQFVVDLPASDADFAAFDAFLAREKHRIAAVMIEPLVQGAGGMRFHAPEQLRRIAEAARAHDLLFIADEIFVGFGRTGSLFACDQAGVVPDIVCLGKALTGGFLALAATVASDRIFEAFLSDSYVTALMHGPTYMGNALACAAANASLDLFEQEPRLDQVRAIETQLRAELEPARTLAGVVDVRVRGAIGVIQLETIKDRDALRRRFVEAGVWIRPFGNIVYATPTYTITPAELTRLTSAMTTVVAM